MRVFTAGVGMVAGSDIAGIVQMVGHGVKTVKVSNNHVNPCAAELFFSRF